MWGGLKPALVMPIVLFTPDSQGEEAFLELVAAVKRLSKTAEKYGTIVGIEGGVAHHHTIHTYEKNGENA